MQMAAIYECGLVIELPMSARIVRCSDCEKWEEPFDTNEEGVPVARCEEFDHEEQMVRNATPANGYCFASVMKDEE